MPIQQALQHDEMRVYRGVCLTNLGPDDGQTIKATAPSLMPGNLQGPLTAGTTTNELSYTDRSGKTIKTEATTSNHIEADWIGKDFHTYPPLVRMGEQVLLYQQGNSDRYFWDTCARNNNQRELDRLRLAVSATPYTQQSKTDKNTYSLTIDPAQQNRITLQTSNANGEKRVYCIDIDTKNNHIILCDDKGDGSEDSPHNSIVLKSDEDTIQLTNNQKTAISLVGKDIIFYCPRDVRLRADRQIVFDSPCITFNGQVTEPSVISLHATALSVFSENFSVRSTIIGLQGALKAMGPVVLGHTRASSFVTGDVGEAYPFALISVAEGAYDIPGFRVDTDTTGSNDREVTAYPQFMNALEEITSAINALHGDGSAIVPAGKPGNIPLIKGQ